MNKTITVQKPNAFFLPVPVDQMGYTSHDKTTTTVRITIHNKYNKSEMNTEMNKIIY